MRMGQPIPWSYSDKGNLLAWVWSTDHFVARIVGNRVPGTSAGELFVRTHHWELADRVTMHGGVPRVIVEGDVRHFVEAEDLLREHVGKAYAAVGDYVAFAGDAANRFELSDGTVIDVGHLVGSRVIVRVHTGPDSYKALTGEFELAGYWWQVTTAEGTFEVLPAHVLHVAPLSNLGATAAWAHQNASHRGVGRFYTGNPGPGCTGRAGFAPDTVDHVGAPRCPVHESEVRDHLLTQ